MNRDWCKGEWKNVSMWHDNSHNNISCWSKTTAIRNSTDQTRFKWSNHIRSQINHTASAAHFRIGLFYPQNDEHQWKSGSYSSYKIGMEIKSLPELLQSWNRTEEWLVHNFGLRKDFGSVNSQIHQPVFQSHHHPQREDDFDYGAFSDQGNQRDQLPQTSSSTTTQSWANGSWLQADQSWQSHCRCNGWRHSQDLWEPSEYHIWRWLFFNTKGSFTRDGWTQLTLMVNIMTQTTFTQGNFVSFFCSCEAFFPAWVNVQENLSLHRPARSKNQINSQTDGENNSDKNADMDHHAVLPPEYQAGSKCQDQYQQDSESVNNNDAMSIKLRTTESGWSISSQGGRFLQQICQVKWKFIFIQLLMEKKYIKKFDDSAKNFKPLSEEEHEVYNQAWNSMCANFGKCPTNLHSCSALRLGVHWRATALWASSWLTQGHEDIKRMAMNKSFPRTPRFDTICTTTSETVDQSQKRIQCANLAGLEHLSMVKTHVAERSSSRVLRFYIVCRSLKSRSIQQLGNNIGGCMARTWICRTIECGTPRSVIHVVRTTKFSHSWQQEAYSEKLEPAKSRICWWRDHIHVSGQRHWKDEENWHRNLFAQCQRNDSICREKQAKTLVLLWLAFWKYAVERKLQRTSKKTRYCRIAAVRIFKCHTSHPICSATEPKSLGHWKKGRSNYHCQSTWDNKKILIKTT